MKHVTRIGRPELGIGEVLETLSGGMLRVAFPHAEDGAYALLVRPDELVEVSEEEAQGRLYAAD